MVLKDLANADRPDFRFIPFGFIALYILTLFFSEYHFGSYIVIAKHFSMGPYRYFYDLKATVCGIDAIRSSIDPYTADCVDGQSLYCYPATWKIFSLFPFITMGNLIYLGFGLAMSFYLALYFFIGKIDLFAAIIYTLLLLSSAFLLAVVQGNTDVFIFLVLIAPVFFNRSRMFYALTILAMSMLKLFPIGAMVCLFNGYRGRTTKMVFIFIGALVLFILFLVILKDNIIRISHIIPRVINGASYGLWSIPSLISVHFHLNTYLTLDLCVSFGLLLCIGFAGYFKMNYKKVQLMEISNDRNGISYMIGAAIFLTSYLMGYSWEYRLIFLIFTIPQVLNWMDSRKPLAKTLLLLTVLISWQYSFMYHFIPEKYENHYHVVVQVLVIFLFYGHLSIILNFFLARYKIWSFFESTPTIGIQSGKH
jgi:hypothetical protein